MMSARSHCYRLPPQERLHHVERGARITGPGRVVVVVQRRGRIDLVDDAAALMQRYRSISRDHVYSNEVRAHHASGELGIPAQRVADEMRYDLVVDRSDL